jgi:hypothetical protein
VAEKTQGARYFFGAPGFEQRAVKGDILSRRAQSRIEHSPAFTHGAYSGR